MAKSIYKRGGIWWGRKQVDGRVHRRSLRTRDRAEALKRYNGWVEDLTAAVHFGESRMLWQDAVLKWVQDVMPGSVSKRTADRYVLSLRNLHPLLVGKPIDSITRATVAEVVAKRKRGGYKVTPERPPLKPVTNATIRRDLTAASQVMQAAISWEAAEANPFLNYDKRQVRERREPIRPPAAEDVAFVIGLASSQGFADLLRFLDQTGARENEGAQLEWRDIDFERGQVTLYKTKRQRARRIRLTPETIAMLSARPRALGSPYVFWHGTGEPFRNAASNFGRLMRRAQKQAQSETREFRRFRAHDLRHGYAIRELLNGRDIYDLSRHLGHTSVKTTEMHYLAWLDTAAGSEERADKHKNGHRSIGSADDEHGSFAGK